MKHALVSALLAGVLTLGIVSPAAARDHVVEQLSTPTEKAVEPTQPLAPPAPAVPSLVEEIVGIYPQPRSVFRDRLKDRRDCPYCPEMVVIPAGQFTMGSPPDEESRSDDEGPQHRATIHQPIAVGKFEITFREWDACVADGGCNGYRPVDEGWGRGNRPVTNVSWQDAQAYVRWLSRKTGVEYRFLSETEWEYAARAGTTTPFHFGSTISPDQANYYDLFDPLGLKGVNRWKTVPVGSFPSNAFGLHDVHGNVWEWVEDCRHNTYAGAPSDGAAWTTGDCEWRVLRGGSWDNGSHYVRSANRTSGGSDNRDDKFGFRVARTLP